MARFAGGLLLDTWRDWVCPNCGRAERPRPLPPDAARMHTCPRLHMLIAPLVRSGADCKIVACEREDYLGREIQRTGENGKPYSSVQTIRADGSNDAWVFAPCAVARIGG